MVSKVFEVAKVEVPLVGQLWRQEQIFIFIYFNNLCVSGIDKMLCSLSESFEGFP
jgi:hypothetical protein